MNISNTIDKIIEKQTDTDSKTDIPQFIKQESAKDISCCPEHKINNYAPLWLATQEVKTELETVKASSPETLFPQKPYFSNVLLCQFRMI